MKKLILILLVLAGAAYAGDSRRDFLIYYDDPNWPRNTDSCNPSGYRSSWPFTIPVCDPAVKYSQETDDSANLAQRASISDRYEFGIGPGIQALDSMMILAGTFAFGVKYVSFQDTYVPAASDTARYHFYNESMTQEESDSDVVFLHFSDNTQISIQGSTVNIPGWPDGDAATIQESRVVVYYSNGTRRMCNYSTEAARNLHVNYAKWLLSNRPGDQYGDTSETNYWSGIWWDNAQPELYNTGTLISGGHVREHPTNARIDSLGSSRLDWWYLYNMKPFFQALKDTMDNSENWMPDGRELYCMLNTAGNTNTRLVTDDICTHIFQENAPSITRHYASYFYAMRTLDILATANGVHVLYSPNASSTVSGGSGSYLRTEVLHSNTCWFYASCSDSALLYHQVINGPSDFRWDTVSWVPSMSQDIGLPAGVLDTLQSGTDPKGYAYTILIRDYDSAIVLLRPLGSWNQDIDAGTAVSVALGGTYYELFPDGTRGSAVTSVDMRNAQGKIMMRGEGTPVQVRKKTANIKIGGVKP